MPPPAGAAALELEVAAGEEQPLVVAALVVAALAVEALPAALEALLDEPLEPPQAATPMASAAALNRRAG